MATIRPDTVKASDSVVSALAQMQKRGYRHLPVVDNGKLMGMVSIRDIYAAMLRELEDELHDALEAVLKQFF